MSKTAIDRAGTFRGKATEWGLSKSSGGFPQFAMKVTATQYYVNDPAEMEAFGLTEVGWVDWSAFDQEAVGFLVLFNAEKALLNFEQIQKALGWDGSDLQALHTGPWNEKEFLFQVEENTYNNNTSLRINWVDAFDAPPVRGLSNLDAEGIKALTGQFAHLLNGKAKAAPVKAPAKAPAKAGPVVGKPVAAPAAVKPATPSTVAAPSAAAKPTTPTATPTAAPSSTPVTIAAKKPPAAKPKVETAPFVADGTTKDAAWAAASAQQGVVSDDTMATLWIDACEAVAPGMAEEAITPAQWLQVQAQVISKLTPEAAAA